LPLEQSNVQLVVESHVMSHSPPEQLTLHASAPLHVP